MAHSTDAHVGGKLRDFRKSIGWSQTALGNAVGMSWQQIQKYENGSNRISCSRLWDFCETLGVRPGEFFVGLSCDDLGGKPEVDFADTERTGHARRRKIALEIDRIKDPSIINNIHNLVRHFKSGMSNG